MPPSHLLTELSKLSKSHSIVFLLAASILPCSLNLMILRSVSLFLRATSMSSISAGRSRHSLLSVSRTLLAQLILLILIVHASSCVVFLIYHIDPLGRPRSHRRRCRLIRVYPLPMVTGSLSSQLLLPLMSLVVILMHLPVSESRTSRIESVQLLTTVECSLSLIDIARDSLSSQHPSSWLLLQLLLLLVLLHQHVLISNYYKYYKTFLKWEIPNY